MLVYQRVPEKYGWTMAPPKSHGRLQWLFLASGDFCQFLNYNISLFFFPYAIVELMHGFHSYVKLPEDLCWDWDNNDHIRMWTAWVGAHQTQALSTMAILHRGIAGDEPCNSGVPDFLTHRKINDQLTLVDWWWYGIILLDYRECSMNKVLILNLLVPMLMNHTVLT